MLMANCLIFKKSYFYEKTIKIGEFVLKVFLNKFVKKKLTIGINK